jgi:hypothetical protein
LLVLALLLDGGTYSVAYLPLLLAFDAAWRLTGEKTRRGIVPAGLLCVLLTGAVSLFRVLPAIETTLGRPRERWWRSDSLELSEFLDILTARWQPSNFLLHEHAWRWTEYGGFVGWTVVVLGAAGVIALLVQRKHGHLIAGAALFAALMMGDRGPWWPWPLLQHIPPYDGLRVSASSRWTFPPVNTSSMSDTGPGNFPGCCSFSQWGSWGVVSRRAGRVQQGWSSWIRGASARDEVPDLSRSRGSFSRPRCH